MKTCLSRIQSLCILTLAVAAALAVSFLPLSAYTASASDTALTPQQAGTPSNCVGTP